MAIESLVKNSQGSAFNFLFPSLPGTQVSKPRKDHLLVKPSSMYPLPPVASSLLLNMFADLANLSLLSVCCPANSHVENGRYQMLFNRNLKLSVSAK